MHSSRSSLATFTVVAVLTACGGATKPAAKAPGKPAGGSLAASLEAELGAPVAVVPSDEGLVAVSADGTKKRVLVPGAVAWALVDNRAQVVWFGQRDSIRLLDVTLPSPAPEDVVAALPTEVIEGAPGIVIGYREDPTWLAIGHPAYHTITLVMDAEPHLEGDPGAWTDDEEFPAAVDAISLAPPVRARLAELWKRGEGRDLALMPQLPETERVAVDTADCPDDEEMCGETSAIPGTPYWRVVVAYSCGDGCHLSYKVYDPATKTFVEGAWTAFVQMSWMAPDGSAIVHDGSITRLDQRGTVHAGSEGVEGGGWLGKAYYLPF